MFYCTDTSHLSVVGHPRTLHPPPVKFSHHLLYPTRGLGRLRLARLLRCALLRIVGLLGLET
jgi:hypothetical protein